jgi:hypothetical protein
VSLRSLITVDVDDSAFVSFQAKFQAFQNAARVSMGLAPMDNVVGSTEGGGIPSGGGITGAGDDIGLAEVVVVLGEIKGLVARIATEITRKGGEGGGDGVEAGAAAGGTADFLGFLKGGLGKLAMGSLLGGLADALGIEALSSAANFVLHGAGMGERAGDVTALRTAAREANVSMGTYRAFQVDLAPYQDGEGLLQNIANAQSDIQSAGHVALQRLGVSETAPSNVGAIAVLKEERALYQQSRGDPLMLQTLLAQNQLTNLGITTGDARSVGAISQKEFDALLASLQSDAKKFEVPDNTAQVWQNLNQTIARSAAAIDTVFTKTLPGAAQAEVIALGALTAGVVRAGNALQTMFPALTSGVTPNTTLPQLGAGAAQELPGAVKAVTGGLFDPGIGTSPGSYNAVQYLATESFGATGVPELPPKGFRWKDIRQAPQTALAPPLAPYGWANIATALGQQESGGNPNAVSPAGAEGLWQIMPATGAQYGYTPKELMNPDVNAQVSSAEWNRDLAEFGNPYEAAAAYNWGAGNLRKDIAAHGKDWDLYLPRETSAYIRSGPLAERLNQINTGGYPIPRQTTITVTNRSNTDTYIQGRLANR